MELDTFAKKLERHKNLPNFQNNEDKIPVARNGKKTILRQSPWSSLKITKSMLQDHLRLTEHYQNDKPFEIVFNKDHPRTQECVGCGNKILRNFLKIPFNIIFSHKEQYQFPKKDEKGKVIGGN